MLSMKTHFPLYFCMYPVTDFFCTNMVQQQSNTVDLLFFNVKWHLALEGSATLAVTSLHRSHKHCNIGGWSAFQAFQTNNNPHLFWSTVYVVCNVGDMMITFLDKCSTWVIKPQHS